MVYSTKKDYFECGSSFLVYQFIFIKEKQEATSKGVAIFCPAPSSVAVQIGERAGAGLPAPLHRPAAAA